jgi:hypothetical protein
MRLAAVAEQAPTRLTALVYLDAWIPRDTEAAWTTTKT